MLTLLKMLSDLPIVKSLGKALKNFIMARFLLKVGAEKQQLQDLKKEEKNVQEAKVVSHTVDSLGSDELRKLLMDCRPGKDYVDE